MRLTNQSEVGHIRQLILKSPEAAFVDDQAIGAQWQGLNYLGRPDYAAALREYEAFVVLLEQFGIDLHFLPADSGTGLDSIYVRDASIVCDAGPILCSMGKADRRGEPLACVAGHEHFGRSVYGAIGSPGCLEGGDVAWLDERTLVVARGYRTNDEGIAQLRSLLPADVDLLVVALPHWQGPADVFHLMSLLSPIDGDLLLVYSPLLPVPFRQTLIARGFDLVEVPAEEFESMGCNVLAVGPRQCVMLEGNPLTQARLEAAGAEVHTYRGDEISRKGCGGPTCLTRPLHRAIQVASE